MTAEQINRAREWDLLSYLQSYAPQELVKSGAHEYRTVQHDSLVISHGKWHWASQGFGGKTALDYLIHVQHIPFTDAVLQLCEGAPFIPQPVKVEKKPFKMPRTNQCATEAVAYLQKRGIDTQIIRWCLKSNVLYAGWAVKCTKDQHGDKAYEQVRACVFVGRDTSGNARYAAMRSVRDSFRREATGSEKAYGFHISPPTGKAAILDTCESPIDAMSRATLHKLGGGDWGDRYYLSLGGTTPLALVQFLRDHPEVQTVNLCLDNDKAGVKGMVRCQCAARAALPDRGLHILISPPVHGKDYNEQLCARTQRPEAVYRNASR